MSMTMNSVGMLDPTDQFHLFAPPQRRPCLPRACEECKRKKTKCDMTRPSCSLCHRIGINCVYPKDRKRPVRRNTAGTRRPYSTATGERRGQPSSPQHIDNQSRTLSLHAEALLSELLDSSVPEQSVSMSDVSCQTTNPPALPPLPTSSLINRSSQNQQGVLNRTQSEEPAVIPGVSPRTPADLYFDLSFSGADQDPLSLMNAAFPWMSPMGEQNPVSASEHSKSQEAFDFGSSSNHEDISFHGGDEFLSRRFEPGNQIGRLPWQSPCGTENSPNGSRANVDDQALLSIDVPAYVADHLINVYFEKVHGFLPLLHRPRFYAEIFESSRNDEERYQQLDFETALLLNGLFALSARFSDWNDYWKSDPKERGRQFAGKCKALCDLGRRVKGDDHLSLRFLQGYILLTYYQLAAGPSFQAWLGIGICCRMAYGISLHQIDRAAPPFDQDTDTSAEEWANKEERRRAWWAIVEMDNCASIISSRPFNIDMHRMDVLLPVADEAWFSLRPVPSTPISSKGPSTAWRSLKECQNQDEHAWFLVCNYLIRSAHEEFEKREHNVEDLKVLQSAIHCFALSLPSKFRISPANMTFNEHNFAGKNWIISTHVLLQNANIFVALVFPDEDLETQESRLEPRPNDNGNTRSPQFLPERSIERCGQYVSDQLRAIQLWSPEFIPLGTPLNACALVGPAAMHAAKGWQHHDTESDDILQSLEGQLLGLVLKRIAEFWDIGALFEGLLRTYKLRTELKTTTPGRPEQTWIQVMLPDILKGAMSPPASSPT